MRTRNPFRERAAGAALSLVVTLGLAAWLPSRGFGQDAAGRKPPAVVPNGPERLPLSPDNSTHPETTVEKRKAQSTGNPLQIRPDSGDAAPGTAAPLSRDFNDYRHLDDGPKRGGVRPLPLFGYEIFRNARETVDAQREFLRQQSLNEFIDQPGGRRRRTADGTTGDVPASTNGSRQARRNFDRTGSDRTGSDQGQDLPPRRTQNSSDDSDTGNADSDGSSRSSQRRSTSRSSRSRSYSQDSYNDNGSYDQNDRSGNDQQYQSGFGTPIGPISLLYRGISASVPDNYTLSSGDVLRIRIESATLDAVTYTKTVDARGQIFIENAGSVVVRGKSISSAEKALEIALRPYFKNVRVSIETGLLRTIPVLVAGAAYEPGTYTVPATATAFNLLNIAGGPSDEGSLRGIEVRRGGKRVAQLDIYKMINGDALWTDVQLAAGDVIMIPPRKTRVTVSGEVLRPAVYELLPKETLRDAVGFAGGIKASGVSQSVRVNTVVPGAERVIRDLNVSGNQLENQPLFDGDVVEVFSVRNRLTNRVSIEGAVDQPNDYALQEGMRISDLVERARGPLSEAYLPQAELHRWQPDNTDKLFVIDLDRALAKDPKYNLLLQKWDRLKVYTREEVAWTGVRKVYVDGAVKRPGIYDVSKNMHVSDLLRMAGGPTPNAELEKAHLYHHHDDGPATHEYVNVAAAVKGDAHRDPEVMDSDRLVIYSVDQASFTPDHRVDIKGEVVNPGRYERFEGMKVSDLMALAGGFRPSASDQVTLAHARRVADTNNTQVVMINFDGSGRCAPGEDVALEDGDVVSVKGVGGFESEVRSITVSGAVKNPGVIFLKSKDMRLSDAIREAGGLRAEAFPDGAEFYRNPKALATTGQRSLVQDLALLNDLLNDSEGKREQAKAQLDLIKATGSAISDSTGLAALTGGSAAAAATNPTASAVAGNIAGSQLVSPARKLGSSDLDPNGLVAVNLRNAIVHPRSADDIVLVDGDEIRVPPTPTTVTVFGAVNSRRAILFEPGRNVDYYLNLAGGLTVDAARDRTEIIHMDGGVLPAKRGVEIKPGDYIFVPPKVIAAKIASKGNGFDSIFRSLTSSAIIFKLATGIFGL